MDEKQKSAAAEEAGVTLAQKILGMTEDELVEAVAMGVAWLSLGGPDKQTTEGAGAALKALAQAMEPGFRELMTQMPWDRAVWELAGAVGGKKQGGRFLNRPYGIARMALTFNCQLSTFN